MTALGAICQGSLGIGLGIVAGPALLAIDPAFGPGPLLFAGQVVGTRHIIAERQHLPVPSFRRTMLGLPVGLLLGIAIVEAVSTRTLSIIIGASVAVAASALLTGLRIPRTPATEVATGMITALCSTVAAIPGPPIVMTFSDLRPNELRALASSFVAVISIAVFISLVATENFGWSEARLLAWMIPGLLLGLGLSRWTRPALDGHRFFRPLILTVALIGGLMLVVRQLV